MSKNYMADIAKMLGVELEEEFQIELVSRKYKLKANYKLTEEGLYLKDEAGNWWQQSNVLLVKILKGEIAIKKLPWKPKIGDRYFYSGFGFNNICCAEWKNTTFDFAFKEAGMIFRTKEECEAALSELRKKYLGEEV